MVHLETWKRLAIEVLKILSNNGANLLKVYMCHLDCDYYEENYYRDIIKTGAYIGFDGFGGDIFLHPIFSMPTDNDRVRILLKLIEDGFINNILIGNDVCMKHRLHKYGGFGYNHFLSNVLPILKEKGLNEKQLNILLIENPKRYLSIEL